MKQIIILCAFILLGLVIYNMIAGPDADSVLNTAKGVWEREIQVQKQYP